MKLLKAKVNLKNKIVVDISELQYIKSMTPLPELLEGEELVNPIEVRKYELSETPRKGVNGIAYAEKNFSVFRGSQRVQAAKQLGYTHIEAVIING